MSCRDFNNQLMEYEDAKAKRGNSEADEEDYCFHDKLLEAMEESLTPEPKPKLELEERVEILEKKVKQIADGLSSLQMGY